MFSLAIGIIIGSLYSWKTTLCCLCAVPFLIINAQFNVKFNQGLSEDTENLLEEAHLFAADCIQNYKTLATLANENKFVRDYEKKLQKVKLASKVNMIGFIFGMSQFIQFAVIGLLFYAGAYFHIEYGGNSQDIFVAIFSMVFGAMSCGQAQQFAPDLGKAR